jgi:hypothetical protein
MNPRILALGLALMVLALSGRTSCPECWRPPPDYNRGPQMHPGQ